MVIASFTIALEAKMITLINGSDRDQFPELIDQMHQLRARVFQGRLGWAVTVSNGRERDRFDEEWPLYVLSVTSSGQVVGCLRALQTTGPNMLADVFSELLPEGEVVRSPLIWESTRFCVDMDYAAQRSSNELSQITGELLCGLFETGLAAGLTHVVSVFDTRMERILRRAGCLSERLAPPKAIGGVMTVAGLFEVSETMVERLHRESKVPYPSVGGDVLERVGLAA
jgi:acyl homoserine lactone synthase